MLRLRRKGKIRLRKPKAPSPRNMARKRRARIVKEFAQEVLKKFGPKYIKSVVLVGSVARDEFKPNSDIDMIVIVDDTRTKITEDMKERLDLEIEEIAEKVNKEIVVQPPYLLTEFWDMVRMSHPLMYNFIRDGIPVYDSGFFAPVKKLLELGRIPATQEAIDAQVQRAERRIQRVKDVKIAMITEDCYYPMVDMTQAVLMSLGYAPPPPNKAAEEFRKHLVEPGIIEEKYAKWLEDVNNFRKQDEHHEVKEASGEEVDEWIKRAEGFTKRMKAVLLDLNTKKKEKIVEKSFDVMFKALSAALKSVNALPDNAGDLDKVFQEKLIDAGLVEKHYMDIWHKLGAMKQAVSEGKVDEIPESEIYNHREYVRKFIHKVGKLMRDYEE